MEHDLKELISFVANLDEPDSDADGAVLEHFGLKHITTPDVVVGAEPINPLNGRTYSHPAPLTSNLKAAVDFAIEVAPYQIDQIMRDATFSVQAKHRGKTLDPAKYPFELSRTVVFRVLWLKQQGWI